MKPKRGEIWVVKAHGRVLGGNEDKDRPAVVVSNNKICLTNDNIMVVYLTSNVTYPLYSSRVNVELKKPSQIKCEAIDTVTKDKLLFLVGRCNAKQMAAIDRALKFALDIDQTIKQDETTDHVAQPEEMDRQHETELEQCKEELNFYKQQYDRLYNAVLNGIEKKRRVGEICD